MDCLLIFIIFIAVVGIAQGQDFTYDGDKGPTHWGDQYNTCIGKHQSPINIDILAVKRVQLPPLKLEGFDTIPLHAGIINSGHTVMLKLNENEIAPTISGGPLDSIYEFSQLHFHWGSNDSSEIPMIQIGSEDLIEGKSFAMELHIVFFKQMYENFKNAMEQNDGLCVVALFFDISDSDNPSYEEFTNLLEGVRTSNTSVNFERQSGLKNFLAPNMDTYFTYDGSLTTPPCLEIVKWIDIKEPIFLSHNQIEMFRSLENSEGEPLNHNFRPIQDIGDRIVLFNTNDIVENEIETEKPKVIKKPTKKLKNFANNLRGTNLIIVISYFGIKFFN